MRAYKFAVWKGEILSMQYERNEYIIPVKIWVPPTSQSSQPQRANHNDRLDNNKLTCNDKLNRIGT